MRLFMIVALLCNTFIGYAVEKNEKELKQGFLIARDYLKKCKKNKTTISIGKIKDVSEYWQNVPKSTKARQKFLDANEDLQNVLSKDKEHRILMLEYNELSKNNRNKANKLYNSKKGEIYARLSKKSKEYRDVRKKRDKALFLCNIVTFEYILDDYVKSEKPFPIELFTE